MTDDACLGHFAAGKLTPTIWRMWKKIVKPLSSSVRLSCVPTECLAAGI